MAVEAFYRHDLAAAQNMDRDELLRAFGAALECADIERAKFRSIRSYAEALLRSRQRLTDLIGRLDRAMLDALSLHPILAFEPREDMLSFISAMLTEQVALTDPQSEVDLDTVFKDAT